MNAIPSQYRSLRGATAAAAAGTTVGEVVLRAGDEMLLVEAGSARLPARRAVSCLVEPEPGDLVLLGGGGERPYILAVLERRGTAPLRLAVRGDLELAAGGRLALRGEMAAEMASPTKLTLAAGDELTVTGRRARLLLEEMVHVGRSLASHVGKLKVVGEALETLADRILSRARRSYRFVGEGDHLRSGTIDHRAEGTLHLRGRDALVTASTIAKVDAGQIHLG